LVTSSARKVADVTLIDKSRTHLWKPLLHEVADHDAIPNAAYRLRAAAGLLRRFQLETSLAEPMRLEAL
jgi:NADH dehydrogenase FAD-containing subunit